MAGGRGRKGRVKAFAKEPALTPLERQQAEARQRIEADYQSRHPVAWATEQFLAVARAEAVSNFGHRRNGTVQTHQAAAVLELRQGALARLHRSGAISNDQLGWALEIAAEHERIDADVAVRSASLEARVDVSRVDNAAFESLGRVRRAMAYTRWRAALPDLLPDRSTAAQHVLAMVVDDLGVTWAARRLRMSVRRTRKVLTDALDLWPEIMGGVARQVDEDDVIVAWARLA